jgi:hypothetical protein
VLLAPGNRKPYLFTANLVLLVDLLYEGFEVRKWFLGHAKSFFLVETRHSFYHTPSIMPNSYLERQPHSLSPPLLEGEGEKKKRGASAPLKHPYMAL